MTTQAQSFSLKLTGRMWIRSVMLPLLDITLRYPELNAALACVICEHRSPLNQPDLQITSLIFNDTLRIKKF